MLFTSWSSIIKSVCGIYFISFLLKDISRSKDEEPVQPCLARFPRTPFGKFTRSFNSFWYKDNPWLEYSVSQNASYCFACRHFCLPGSTESSFTSEFGFSNWKKALFKDSGFKLHSKSDQHANAMYAWAEYKRSRESEKSIFDALNENRKQQVEKKLKLHQDNCRGLTLNCYSKHCTEGPQGGWWVWEWRQFLSHFESRCKAWPLYWWKTCCTGQC